MRSFEVIIVGGGQAGLSASYYCKQNDINYLILEKSRMVDVWRSQRWDNFCLVTPNWQCQLPGWPYNGNDPDGFMVKNEIVEYLEGYVSFLKPNVLENTEVKEISHENGEYRVVTDNEVYLAKNVIIACGSYHFPKIPGIANNVDSSIQQIHTADYKNADSLPPGGVLVVGSGQSGAQIAEDLMLEGRNVHLAVGHAPRVSRNYRGKDVVKWLDEMGYYETTIDEHESGEEARKHTNHYVTGRDGGRDINLRLLAKKGMQLHGRLASIDGQIIAFEDNLKQNLDSADEVAKRINDDIEKYIVENGISAPEDDNIWTDYLPDSTTQINLRDEEINSIIWATGFCLDYSWIDCDIFNERGLPNHHRGVTESPGLYFLGLNWQYKWGSGRFYQVGEDAKYLVDIICTSLESSDKACLGA